MQLTEAMIDAAERISRLLDIAETDLDIVEMVVAAVEGRCIREADRRAGHEGDEIGRVMDTLSQVTRIDGRTRRWRAGAERREEVRRTQESRQRRREVTCPTN